MSQVITASRLTDGVVVFLSADAGWVDRIDRAKIFEAKAATAQGLEQAKAGERQNLVVDIYAIEVSTKAGAVVPTKLREAIRARGPTIHPAFAKPGSVPAKAQEDDHVSV
jgi:hypothetical protein